jgi:TatD DNase family protein
LGRRAIELGFLLGIGGTVTFKNSGVAEVVSHFNLDDLVIETDSPFLAPAPFRGKRNEPSYVTLVAERLAAVFGTPVDEIEVKTSTNARKLFGI